MSNHDRSGPWYEENSYPFDADDHIKTLRKNAMVSDLRVAASPDNSGLKLRRVKRFVGGVGLRICDFRITAPDNAFKIDLALRFGGARKPDDRWQGLHGFYNPNIDLAVAYRDRKLEQLNSRGLTESWLVHELGHGSSNKAQRLGFLYKISSQNPSKLSGLFFEEGFAEALRALYIKSELKSPNGFVRINDESNYTTTVDGYEVIVPNIYRHRDAETTTAFNISCLGGAAIDRLVETDPSIWHSIVGSRQDDDQLTTVEHKINSLKPGLYDDLMSVDSYDDFSAGLNMVIELTGSN